MKLLIIELEFTKMSLTFVHLLNSGLETLRSSPRRFSPLLVD
uniref:Uncharacterized protein n=1 Tax=Arundo donax TaxID=35708 RepID=A0A0A8ZWU7_ARUDO